MSNKSKHIPYWDNLKGLLILLVVFGHLIERIPNGTQGFVYKFIYLFHMPLFVFSSGFLSSFSAVNIWKRLIVPYFIMQTIMCLWNHSTIGYTTPYWILWYLLALIFWKMSIPFLDLVAAKYRGIIIVGSFLISYLCGLDSSIGYYLSLSRTICFFPYFILGYYIHQYKKKSPDTGSVWKRNNIGYQIVKYASAVLTAAVLCGTVMFADFISAKSLYCSSSYDCDYLTMNLLFRIAQSFAAVIIGTCVLTWIPTRKNILTVLGASSMCIYLLHPFLIKMPFVTGIKILESPVGRYLKMAILAFLFCLLFAAIHYAAGHLMQIFKERKSLGKH